MQYYFSPIADYSVVLFTRIFINPFNPKFTIAIFINYKPQIPAVILALWWMKIVRIGLTKWMKIVNYC